jgi:3-oxoacyl-[acyl-carrier-protein] synthase III
LSHLYGNETSGNASSASSEFSLKDAIRRKRFEDDEEVITEVKRRL